MFASELVEMERELWALEVQRRTTWQEDKQERDEREMEAIRLWIEQGEES